VNPRTSRHGVIGAAVAVLVGAALPAQPKATPQSKVMAAVRVNVVNVEVVVTDSAGKQVLGLAARDFEVLEDGKPAPITNFYASGPAVPAASVPPAATPTQEQQTPLPEAPPAEELALSMVVFVDNANIAYTGRKTVLESVATMLGRVLRPGDRVMVVTYDLSMKERRSFTTDPARAVAALRDAGKEAAEGVMTAAQRQRLLDMMARDSGIGVAPPSSRGMSSSMPDTFTAQKALENVQSFAQQRFDATRSQLKALGNFVDSLAGLPGRKVVLYISQGITPRPGEDLFIEWENRFPQAAQSLQRSGQVGPAQLEASTFSVTSELREVEHRANAGRVTFITVNASSERGMEGLSADTKTMSAQPGLAGMEAMMRAQSLLDFARTTGGRSLVNTPALADALTAAAEDLHTFYSIGYSPEHFGDGKYHRITVKVKVPGLTVRHREGYLDKPPEQRLMDRTAGALLAESAVVSAGSRNPLGVVVTLGRPTTGQGKTLLMPLTVRVPASRLTLLPQGNMAEGNVSVFFVVKDEQGRSSDPQRVSIPMRVPLDKLDAMLKQDATFTFQLMVREGKQRVAVTLQDDVTEEASTVVAEVNVPSKAFLGRSGP
jgi:VWFA-related protein